MLPANLSIRRQQCRPFTTNDSNPDVKFHTWHLNRASYSAVTVISILNFINFNCHAANWRSNREPRVVQHRVCNSTVNQQFKIMTINKNHQSEEDTMQAVSTGIRMRALMPITKIIIILFHRNNVMLNSYYKDLLLYHCRLLLDVTEHGMKYCQPYIWAACVTVNQIHLQFKIDYHRSNNATLHDFQWNRPHTSPHSLIIHVTLRWLDETVSLWCDAFIFCRVYKTVVRGNHNSTLHKKRALPSINSKVARETDTYKNTRYNIYK